MDALHKVLAVRLTSRTPGVAVNPAEPLTLVRVDNERATHLDVAYDAEPRPPLALFSRVAGGEEIFDQPAIISLPDGRKLARGSFNRVNGIARPGLARLLANDDLDEGFVPDVVGEADQVVLLRSGDLIVFYSTRRQIVRLKSDGRRDETIQIPPEIDYTHLAVAEDNSLWFYTGEAAPLFYFASNGVKIGEFEHPVISPRCEECPGWNLVGLLPDGRLIFRSTDGGRDFVQVFHLDGRPDTSVPILTLEHANNGGGLAGANGVLFKVTKRFPPVRFLNLPITALQITTKPSPSWGISSEFNEIESTPDEPKFLNVVFQRLGSSAASATAHYTTRDVTALAGKDYEPKSGTINFAPLETEKAIQIPILADTEDEFHETLEVAVTGAEGFEALPAPMRLTIFGKGPPPRLERVKRLRDGCVLLGGTGPPDTTRLEFSTDLKTWHPLTNQLGGFTGSEAVWLDPSATNAPTRYYRAVTP